MAAKTTLGDGTVLISEGAFTGRYLSGRIQSIYVTENGMVVCFDHNGEPLPDCRGPLHELLSKLLPPQELVGLHPVSFPIMIDRE